MAKFLVGLGAVFLGFGLYNLIFPNSDIYLTEDWFIPYINIRYSTLTTPLASQIIIGVGFVIMIVGIILYQKRNKY